MSFLSQLLSQGAAKSRADYNTQQQINELLREGWVPKGQGGMEDPTVAADPAVAADPVIAEEDPMDPAITKEGIEAIYNSGDPKLAEILNEMLSSVGKGEIEEYSLGDTSPEAENQRRLDRRELYPEHYLEEQKRQDEANATPGRDPNIPDEFGRSTFFDEGKDIDIVGSAQYSSSTPEDFRNYVNSFAREEKEAQQDNINPDPESRNFVKKAFKDVRSGIDGFSPAGEEAGHWLKPIAEQLNSMFGRSVPLDMDGYEMGPYHAQRIAMEKMNREDERHREMMDHREKQLEVLKEHYDNMNHNERDRIEQQTLNGLLTRLTDLKKLEKAGQKVVKSGDIPSPADMEYFNTQEKELVESLFEMIDDTGFAGFAFGQGTVLGQWSTIDKDDGLEGIMPTLYLMMGLNEDGSIPEDPSWYNLSQLFKQEPNEIKAIEQAIETIENIRALRRDMAGYQIQAINQEEPRGSHNISSDDDLIEEMVPLLRSILERNSKTDPLKTRVGE